MCDLHDHHGLPPLEADEYVLDTPFVRELVAAVREQIDRSASAADACERSGRSSSRRSCTRLASGGVQAGRARQRHGRRHRPVAALPLGRPLALPLQPRRAARVDDPDPRPPRLGARGALPGQPGRGVLRSGRRQIELTRRRPLAPGDYYVLLPPADDIHRVRTTSAETSVSIHLLANDTGCAERHTFDDRTGEARPFRSGYANAICEAESVS